MSISLLTFSCVFSCVCLLISLAKRIGSKWQSLDATEVQLYKDKAAEDMERYRKAMEEYNQKRKSNETEHPSETTKRQKTA